MKNTISLLSFVLFLVSCNNKQPDETASACLKEIANSDGCTKTIHSYKYDGENVYLLTPDCPDYFYSLYDINCNLICHPSGGLSGDGDGKCSDFYDKAKNENLIWERD